MPFILYANPIDVPELWDVVFVGGAKSPGLVKVNTDGLKYNLDKKKGKGTQKRTVTFTGADGVDVKLKFRFWLSEHFDAWAQYQNLFEYDPSKKNDKAIDVTHPKLAFLGVHNFVTERIGPINEEGEGSGLFTVEVDLAEYAPPPKKSAVSTPAKVKATGDDHGLAERGTFSVGTQQDRDLEALLEQASRP